MGECHVRNVKVEGSNPFASTKTAQETVLFTHLRAEKSRFFSLVCADRSKVCSSGEIMSIISVTWVQSHPRSKGKLG